ncbi:hypothetical protein PFICI_11549 [Pestalotiopsis fici W106-1]|uniref:catechol O-methyltransferase n=1 Tax=Pestalotiopsis fici (strain W106-1 / CGMCC3.15140) TaxID=1229662 RepID=W3WSM7_PESFW|nr:uncharacterized protein PFICI_11549 [Pestalotiopsis fici W106-1]ETS76162.1 hypothetical protein PFICI_11549 [Pestalotiopsis fici W106-1]
MAEPQQRPSEGEMYQPIGNVWCNDGREIALLHWIFKHPKLEEMRGHPEKVLDAIDEYGKAEKYLMNVGKYKSKTVIDIINTVKPAAMVELGGYVGYSAIAFGAAARAAGGQRYYSLEQNPEFGAIATLLVDLAGLGDFVKIVIESSGDALKRLHKTKTLEHIDLLFIDHTKPLYTPDLKVAEELGLVKPGSVCVADNVVIPGNPVYLEYVRSTVEQKRERYNAATEGPKGNPDLVYENQFIEGWEPSGLADALEVSRCVKVSS